MTRLVLGIPFRKLFSFKGYKLSGIDLADDVLTARLQITRRTGDCPACGRRCTSIEDSYSRSLRDLDLGGRKCFLELPERKIRCHCGFRGMEKLGLADPYSRCTTRFEEYVFKLCKLMTVFDVAELLGLSWHTVKNIDKKHLSRLVPTLDEISPTRIGVDEISHHKGHKYLTVVRDIDLGKVIWIGFKRKKETLDEFFTELGGDKTRKMRVVVLDMWDPYIASVREHTNAEIVFDKFHVAKKINEALDSVRKREFAEADPETRKQWKKKRFLMLSRRKRLSEERVESLDNLMAENEPLYKAYLLKEQGLDIFDEQNREVALRRFDAWFKNVAEAGFREFEAVVDTIKNYFYGVAAYFKHRLTNAASEGFNNKINVIKRRAYGFHDIES